MRETPTSATFPVVYEAMNRELRTVRQYFMVRGIPEDIPWEADIVEGDCIAPGKLLGHIIWASAPAEGLRAPAECAGRIEWIERRIPYEVLHRRSIPLLRLATG
jgi:hypothetical protein